MKNLIKVVCATVLALASFTATAKQIYYTNPVVPPATVTSVVPADASGYWSSYQVPGLSLVLSSGKYYAPSYGGSQPPSTCGKVLKATVSIPRTSPTNGWQFAAGHVYDSTGTGVPFGQSFNLLTKSALAGTMSVVAYDAVNNYLTVQLSTPAGGPTGTYVLNRDPLLPYTALITPNCP